MTTSRARPSRQLAVVVSVFAMFAAGCGSEDAPQLGDQLPPSAESGEFAVDLYGATVISQLVEMEQRGDPIEQSSGFDVAASIDLEAFGTVFDPAGQAVDDSEIDERTAGLAAILGLDAPVETVGADDPAFGGASRRVGTEGSGVFEVNAPTAHDGGSFSFRGSAELSAGLEPCPTLPDGGCEHDVVGGPPASTEQAESQIAEVMAVLGVASESYSIQRSEYPFAVEFFVTFAPGGVRSDVGWGFSAGSTGAVANAYGPFSAPMSVAEVPLVDLATAVGRLHVLHPAIDMPPPTTGLSNIPVTTNVVPPTDLPATTNVATTTTTTTTLPVGGDTIPPIPPNEPSPSTTAVPFPNDDFTMPVVEPPAPSRTIVDAAPTLTMFWDSPTGPWLLPAYEFIADDGTFYDVLAVASSHLVVSEPPISLPPPTTMAVPQPEPLPTTSLAGELPMTVPMPTSDQTPPPTTTTTSTTTTTEPGVAPPDEASVTTLSVAEIRDRLPTVPIGEDPGADDARTLQRQEQIASLLVGLPVEIAVEAVDGSGWTIRVIDLDGPGDMTADLQSDRINVYQRSGWVERVELF